MKKKLLILTDGKAGHENQSRAFARALGASFEIFEIHFRSKFAKAFSYLADHLNLSLTSLFDRPLPSGDFAAVVGAGSGTFYAARVVGKKLNIPCAAILYPRGYNLSHFSCILAPNFDRPKNRQNVLAIPANIVANDEEFYKNGVEDFYSQYTPDARDAVAVIIGGPNTASTMSASWVKSELEKIFASSPNSLHWLTTSRRTPKDVEDIVELFPWDYKVIYSRNKFNPIPAFVALAKHLYVSAESTGMLSEVCTCGNAKVSAMDNLKPGDHKFRRFLTSLQEGGYVNGNKKIDLSRTFARAASLLKI